MMESARLGRWFRLYEMEEEYPDGSFAKLLNEIMPFATIECVAAMVMPCQVYHVRGGSPIQLYWVFLLKEPDHPYGSDFKSQISERALDLTQFWIEDVEERHKLALVRSLSFEMRHALNTEDVYVRWARQYPDEWERLRAEALALEVAE